LKLIEDITLLIAAFLAALFGQGGGVLYTPLQVWNGINFNTAASTSLFLILITSFSSTIVFRKAHKVDWGLALAMEVPTTSGAFLGGILSHYVSARTLGLLLSILLGVAAWFMLFPPKSKIRPKNKKPVSRWIWLRSANGKSYQLDLRLMIPIMLAVGALTSMVGIGGGALKVPLMACCLAFPFPLRSVQAPSWWG